MSLLMRRRRHHRSDGAGGGESRLRYDSLESQAASGFASKKVNWIAVGTP